MGASARELNGPRAAAQATDNAPKAQTTRRSRSYPHQTALTASG